MKVGVAIFRKQGVRLVIYLEDLLFLNSTKEGVLVDLKVAIELIESLGFLINWSKSVIMPIQVMNYLGIIVESLNLSFVIPKDKVELVKIDVSSSVRRCSVLTFLRQMAVRSFMHVVIFQTFVYSVCLI